MRSGTASWGIVAVMTGLAVVSPGHSADRQPSTVAGLQAAFLIEGADTQVLELVSAAQTSGLTGVQIAHALGRTAYTDQARLQSYREALTQLAGQGLDDEFEAGWRSEVILRDQRGLTFPPLGGYGGSEGGRNQ